MNIVSKKRKVNKYFINKFKKQKKNNLAKTTYTNLKNKKI